MVGLVANQDATEVIAGLRVERLEKGAKVIVAGEHTGRIDVARE
jgi:hypothetical protein